MSRLKTILTYIRLSNTLKYVVVIVAGVVIVGFVDENSVWNHFRNKQHINELQTEIQQYRQMYQRDQAQLYRLDRDPKAIEKIARERYFMKMDDEDIFVLSDDDQHTQQSDNEGTE